MHHSAKELGSFKGIAQNMASNISILTAKHTTDQGEKPMAPVTRHQLIALLILLQTLVGANVIASLETTHHIAKVKSEFNDPPPKAIVAPPVSEDPKSILRNSLSMLWIAGGTVLGAYVCTALRSALNFAEGPKTFGVAMAFSIPISAFILHQYFDNRPEYCFIAGFGFAGISWWVIEIIIALQQKWKKTAGERGLAGLRDEVTFKDTSYPHQPHHDPTPTPTPQPPENKGT